MFAGVRTALLCCAAAAAPAPPAYVTPLNVELIPDTAIATAGNFVFTRCTFLNPGCQFNSGASTPQWQLGVANTQGQVLTPGTYRLQVTVANWVSQTGLLLAKVGCDTGAVGGTSGSWGANTITGNGVLFLDIVVAANTTGGGFQIRTSSGSGNQMDFTRVSLKRIA